MDRRRLGGFLLVALAFVEAIVLQAADKGQDISPEDALQHLKAGNERYANASPQHPRQTQARRAETASKGQHPIATVLACSDSRVPVEILFDAGVGDIFVVRVAGNVADVDEVGSIEYGIDHLGTPVLVVLGHTHCGAVTAVVKDAELHGSIPALVDNIRPAVARTKKAHPELTGDALVAESIKSNVWQAVDNILETSAAARRRVKAGQLRILGAVYDIETGKIAWLGTYPEQDRLLETHTDPPAPLQDE